MLGGRLEGDLVGCSLSREAVWAAVALVLSVSAPAWAAPHTMEDLGSGGVVWDQQPLPTGGPGADTDFYTDSGQRFWMQPADDIILPAAAPTVPASARRASPHPISPSACTSSTALWSSPAWSRWSEPYRSSSNWSSYGANRSNSGKPASPFAAPFSLFPHEPKDAMGRPGSR